MGGVPRCKSCGISFVKALADFDEASRLDPKVLPADSTRAVVNNVKARREKSRR
jgi:hypothetical protein